MGKVEFISDRCFGCGACCNIASENFTFGDDGRTVMISNKLNDAAIEASEVCPASAIIIHNDDECCDKKECSHECNCNNNCECEDNSDSESENNDNCECEKEKIKEN